MWWTSQPASLSFSTALTVRFWLPSRLPGCTLPLPSKLARLPLLKAATDRPESTPLRCLGD